MKLTTLRMFECWDVGVLTMESEVFTPRDPSGVRLRFNKSDVTFVEPYRHGRGSGFKGYVIIAGRKYKVYRASCGADNCNCDAVMHPVELRNEGS